MRNRLRKVETEEFNAYDEYGLGLTDDGWACVSLRFSENLVIDIKAPTFGKARAIGKRICRVIGCARREMKEAANEPTEK